MSTVRARAGALLITRAAHLLLLVCVAWVLQSCRGEAPAPGQEGVAKAEEAVGERPAMETTPMASTSALDAIEGALSRAGFARDTSVPFAEHAALQALHDHAVAGQGETQEWVLSHDEGYVQLVVVVFETEAHAATFVATMTLPELGAVQRGATVAVAIPFDDAQAVVDKLVTALEP